MLKGIVNLSDLFIIYEGVIISSEQYEFFDLIESEQTYPETIINIGTAISIQNGNK